MGADAAARRVVLACKSGCRPHGRPTGPCLAGVHVCMPAAREAQARGGPGPAMPTAGSGGWSGRGRRCRPRGAARSSGATPATGLWRARPPRARPQAGALPPHYTVPVARPSTLTRERGGGQVRCWNKARRASRCASSALSTKWGKGIAVACRRTRCRPGCGTDGPRWRAGSGPRTRCRCHVRCYLPPGRLFP
jgi:hypothetical protein